MSDLLVETKRMPNNKKWSCYTTYKGMDKAFVGKDISVVVKMADWLKDEDVNIIWACPVIHSDTEPIKCDFVLPRLDNAMV